MSDFIRHKTVADRAATDRRRHRAKIEDAIKRGVTDVVAEESIIGQDGKKKIRVPVRGIKEYRFVYDDNEKNGRVGSAPNKDIRRGQKVGEDPSQKRGKTPSSPGNKPGEEYYEIEITLEELTDYLFSDLELPDLERKKMKRICGEKLKRHGYRSQGIRPRLDKKKSLKQLIKRRKASRFIQSNNSDDQEDIGFHDNDLRYRHIKVKNREASSAVIFFLMDISGSMTKLKKYLARSFYFLLYHFLRSKYEHVEIVFVAHDTSAYEVSEEQFFKRGNSGGTLVSTGLEKVQELIAGRYHPTNWNVYCFQCSDGDNWPQDMQKTKILIEQLKTQCQLFGYCEIRPTVDTPNWDKSNDQYTILWETYEMMADRTFKLVNIHSKSDIWSSFKRLFGATRLSKRANTK
jgi:sporulation protein YhbH